MIFYKLFFKLFHVCLPLKNLVNEKHFWMKEKLDLICRKIFSFYFGRTTLFKSYKKFKNILIFVNYIKFDHLFFDWYIFCFEYFFFQFPPRIWFIDFYINFGFYFFFFFFSLIFFLINFLSIRFYSHSFLFEIIYENYIYFFQFHHLSTFLSVIFGHHSLNCYLFYLK
jgi:hypothetical protein